MRTRHLSIFVLKIIYSKKCEFFVLVCSSHVDGLLSENPFEQRALEVNLISALKAHISRNLRAHRVSSHLLSALNFVKNRNSWKSLDFMTQIFICLLPQRENSVLTLSKRHKACHITECARICYRD